MSQGEILIDKSRAGIAVLTLNRPERLNALSQQTVRRLSNALDELSRDDSVRVILLTGAGRGFCAGWDLSSPLTDSHGEPIDGQATVTDYYRGQQLFAGMVRRLRASPKVIIAAINGVAVGAGFALTLAADIRLASTAASFHVGAVRIGLTAGECGISYHLPRLVGASRAFEIMLSGRPVSAAEAGHMGLVSATVEGEQLLEKGLEMAAMVLRNSPYSTHHTKQLMWANLEAGSLDAALEVENHAQVLALLTEDFHEASRAFAEKRPPVFTGR